MNPMFTGRSLGERELVKEGWTKQFFASGSRLQEATELYKSMGLEVHLKPIQAEDLGCSECHLPEPPEAIENCYVIYTRPRAKMDEGGSPDTHGEDEELW